ncbi:MAG: DUF4296 domain-containing protein [Schleiferiaceae bacterium]
MATFKGKVRVGLLVMLFACARPVEPIPKSIIAPDDMVPIMVDVHIIEGARNGTLILGDTNQLEDYYSKLYKKYNITASLFKESFSFYSDHPEHFIPIYERVVDSLKINGALIARKSVEIDHDR